MKTDGFNFEYPCPECHLRFPVSISQLAEGGIIYCPRCRANNAEGELREIEHKLEKLGKLLQNVKKNLAGSLNLKESQ